MLGGAFRLVTIRVRGRRFVHGVAVLAGGTAMGQVLSVAAAPLLTRLYTPADFGVVAVYVSMLSIALVVVAMRYDLAIPLPKDDGTAGDLLLLSLLIVLVISTAVTAVIGVFGAQLVHLMNTPEMARFLWLLPVGLVVAGVYQVLTYWAIRKRAYGRLARTKLSRSAAAVGVQSALGFFATGPLGLIIGEIVGRASGTATLAALAWSPKQQRREGDRAARRLILAARQYYRFPLFSSGSGFLNASGLYLPAVLLASFYGAHVAGLFGFAQRVIEAPIRLIGQSVAQVYLAEAATVARESPEDLKKMFFRTARRLFVIGAAPIMLGGVAAPWLFDLAFGSDWRGAGVFVRLLSWYIAARFIVLPLSQTLNLLDRQDVQLAWDAGRVVAVIGIFVLSAHLGWPATYAVRLFGIGMFVCYSVLFALGAREVCRVGRGNSPRAVIGVIAQNEHHTNEV